MSDNFPVFGNISLGGLIDALAKCPDAKNREVMFDWCGIGPTRFSSYRGYYEQIALGYEDEHRITAAELHELALDALQREFHGWKGGTYLMTRSTPVWVANPGHCHGVGIVDVDDGGDGGWRVVLKTALVDP